MSIEKNIELDTLGKRLQFLRKSTSVTQKFIFESTGVSQSNLSKYERDITQPTSDAIISICQFYKISADWLLFGVESKKLEVVEDPELERMIILLRKMMQGDQETRIWAKKQFEYCFKSFIEEEEERLKKQEDSDKLHVDVS